ncbi:cell division protein FtsQ/DivIB [Streptomyces albipurpureus]|uniref:Cell division protein FtsQ n=1 Tax=Streptomyces albipurpureus TaxID=2897419 RepID=A0ABT0UUZ8_9ACTN|nr:FtsQ-type POTRA domain-containing protein [Streptomyces sp. CWNU-1]MCM2392404.1 FtsQ-type POTRA domain-containing protein [Streptomyces sp. CWNU-1]
MAGPTTAERGARDPSQSSQRPSGPSPDGPDSRATRLRRLLTPRVLLLALAALALVAGGIWLLYGSDWLRVERVQATGTRVLTTEQVVRAAAVPMGAPLISLDTDSIEARLRERIPRIDSVEVSRSWPHGITLAVTERKPVLLLPKGEQFVEVDAGGVRFATVDKAPKAVPLLKLSTEQAPSLRRFPTDRLIAEAVLLTGQLPEKVAQNTRSVVVRSYDDMSLELGDGRVVVWGSPEEGEAKARALAALLKAAPKARRFDVSSPIAPASSGS